MLLHFYNIAKKFTMQGDAMNGPDPENIHPMNAFPQVCFIKKTIKNPNIIVGDYTYYDDPDGSENFERNVLYLFPFIGDKLVIGKFCAIAKDVKFIMNGANHKVNGFSTFPFYIFGNGWEKVTPARNELPYKGDTVIGNDVWLGYNSLIMPGVKIGDGAIIASKSVVTKDVGPYEIFGGNPAVLIRKRFDPEIISRLISIAWWDWEIEKITRNLGAIAGADISLLEKA
jgi:virginiamycin A acetyltransferase